MIFIKSKKIYPFIPSEMKKFAGFYPYMIPIFGRMYFGRIKRIIKIFQKLNRNFSKVLEIGGGFGIFSLNFKINFPKSNVFLLDIYPKKIMKAVKEIMKKKFNIQLNYYYNLDIQQKTPFEDKTFDAIFALDVLEHLEDVNAAVNEIFRILKKGGILFISVPIEGKLLIFIREFICKIRSYNTNPHWCGIIKSEKEFYNFQKQKKIQILWRKRYPFHFVPKIFSYDVFYLIKK